MDYCRSCGSELTLGVHRCPSCGAVVDEFAPPPEQHTGDDLQQEVRDLARREGRIAAVKRYREATGCNLKTAKDVVERLMVGGDARFDDRLPLEHVEADVLQIAHNQGKIAAIKRYREATNAGLKEAKEAVEALMEEHGVQPQTGSGCAGVLLLLLAAGWSLWLQL